jgi:hypothetical protein
MGFLKLLLVGCLLFIGFIFLDVSVRPRYDACQKAVYRGYPYSWFKERGLADAISLGFIKCLESDETPEDYAKNHVWTQSPVEPTKKKGKK